MRIYYTLQIPYYLNGDLPKEQPYSVLNIHLAQWYFIISVIFQIILNKGTRDEDEMKMCPQNLVKSNAHFERIFTMLCVCCIIPNQDRNCYLCCVGLIYIGNSMNLRSNPSARGFFLFWHFSVELRGRACKNSLVFFSRSLLEVFSLFSLGRTIHFPF